MKTEQFKCPKCPDGIVVQTRESKPEGITISTKFCDKCRAEFKYEDTFKMERIETTTPQP